MLILFWVVTVLFTIVQSRIIHYSSMAWFPVTFLAAYSIYKWDRGELGYKKYVGIGLAILGGLISLLILGVAIIGLNVKKAGALCRGYFCPGQYGGRCTLVRIRRIDRHPDGRCADPGYPQSAPRAILWPRSGILFVGTAIVIFFATAIIVPKVERYSQGADIDFFIARQGEDCYVHTLGFKSYGDLFYTKKKRPTNPNSYDQQWLLTGPIDKPVYFVTKVDRVQNWEDPANTRT